MELANNLSAIENDSLRAVKTEISLLKNADETLKKNAVIKTMAVKEITAAPFYDELHFANYE